MMNIMNMYITIKIIFWSWQRGWRSDWWCQSWCCFITYFIVFSITVRLFFRAVKENDKKYGDKKNTNNNKGVISDADLWTDKYSVKYEEKKDEEVIQQPTDKIRYNDDNRVYTSSEMFNKG